MLTLNDGRSELWQWDTGRKLTVDADCSQVHFSNKVFGRSIDMPVIDGVVEIPDFILQTDKDLTAWAFVGTAENGYTKISKVFKVNKRNKPADYVFTPTEQTTLDEIMKRLDRIEEGQDPDAIKNAVDEYLANNPIEIEEKDPTVPDWAKQPTKPKYTADEVGAVATVNGQTPDENGNVQIEIPETSKPDMTGYATERYVQENYQPKGNYLTEVPEDYAKTEDIPTKPEDIGAQPAGHYLTEVPSGYATEEFVKNKIAEAELGGEEVDLSGYAQKSELPTKVSELENDAGYLTEHQDLSDYAKKTELPVVPVQSVNGKTGSVKLSASDVGARPSSWMPTAQEVGALPVTYVPPNQTAAQVGADPAGTAAAAVSTHNTSTDSHGDLRLELKAINDRLTAFFDSDNQTLDELSEIVAYITSNKALIDSITTSKVSVTDIINNLATNVANKPLSAAQGVVLKGLIDAVSASLSDYQPKGDYALASAIPTKVSQLQNDKGYLTKHQDISGKLDADKLPEAVNNALAQAKESGEFDGAKGDPGQAATFEITGATALAYGVAPTITEQSDSTAQARKYVVGIPAGKPGADAKSPILTMYISPDGSDSNDGLTADTPKKTVKACVNAGASRISAKRGVYAEQVAVSGVEHFEIYPTDNGQEYSTDADWPPIVFDLSDTLAPANLAAYNSIKRIAYTNSANEQFDKVFTKKSQSPVSDEYGKRYNATVWLMSNDEKTVCIKLKPTLTVAECEAEANTFAWVSGYIYINADMTGVEKICVPTNFDSGFRIADAGKVILREVEVRFSGSYNVWLLNCPYFDFYKVSARYSSYASGIDIDNANGRLNACYATKNFDGFGVSGYGHTTYIDCVAEFNFDDGVSHHNGSCGTFIGGRYEGNGKGGNTPAYGAQVNIYGGIYNDNAQFGIGYLYTSGKTPAGGVVQGAVMVGNPVGLSVAQNCNVTAIGCIYVDNTADKNVTGNLTEYNHNYVKSVNGVLPDENGNVTVEGGTGDEDTGPKNLLPLAINSDGTPYVGTNGEKGYKVGWRLNSSGDEKEQAGCVVTGFIPVKAGDVLRIKNFTANTAGYGYMFTYKADFTKYGNAMNGTAMVNGIVDGVLTVDISEQFAGSAQVAAYVRFSASEISEDTIVTVNEEIPA